MKFHRFFKVHQLSSNLQNIFESSSETCMWNLSPFREVIFFHRKMLTVPALEISWNFNIFSRFTKFHQTCRTYLNHHQKHACEIWAHSEKCDLFHRKMLTVPALWNIMKFQHFFKVHQISSNLQNIFESSSETCMWNLSPFREAISFHSAGPRNIMNFQHFFKVHQISSNLQNLLESSSEKCMWNLSPFRKVDLFQRKMLTVPALEISWNFNIFSKFTNFHQTCRSYLDYHQKHACEIWAQSEKLTYFIEKCRQCRPFEISWNFNIFSKFIKFHQTCRPYCNHHQKHASEIWAFTEKLNFFIEKCRQSQP